MPTTLRSAAFVLAASGAIAGLAACSPSTPAASQHKAAPVAHTASGAATPSAVTPSAATPTRAKSPTAAPSAAQTAAAQAEAVPASAATYAQNSSSSAQSAAPASAATPVAASRGGGCATRPGYSGVPGSSITVCPDAGPVGTVVHVTIKSCAPTGDGLPDVPAGDLRFLGPDSWLGTNGGGGDDVPFSPRTGSEATATFTIPSTYTGGNENGPYPTLPVKPGTGYSFVTDPAGECNVPFTVTGS